MRYHLSISDFEEAVAYVKSYRLEPDHNSPRHYRYAGRALVNRAGLTQILTFRYSTRKQLVQFKNQGGVRLCVHKARNIKDLEKAFNIASWKQEAWLDAQLEVDVESFNDRKQTPRRRKNKKFLREEKVREFRRVLNGCRKDDSVKDRYRLKYGKKQLLKEAEEAQGPLEEELEGTGIIISDGCAHVTYTRPDRQRPCEEKRPVMNEQPVDQNIREEFDENTIDPYNPYLTCDGIWFDNALNGGVAEAEQGWYEDNNYAFTKTDQHV